jgi:hypothetical protein
MTKYFFDFEDGANIHRDDEGIELSDVSLARQQMRFTLLERGKEIMANDEQRQLVGIIRDESGVLWRGRLSLEAR